MTAWIDPFDPESAAGLADEEAEFADEDAST